MLRADALDSFQADLAITMAEAKVCSLHPAACTPHPQPAPRTLHPAPCTPHLAPRTLLHPAHSCTPHRAPHALHLLHPAPVAASAYALTQA